MFFSRSKLTVYFVGLLMLIGALIPFVFPEPVPMRAVRNIEEMVPHSFGVWKIDNSANHVLPSPDVQTNLNDVYEQILSRTYSDDKGKKIMLTIGYASSQKGKQKSHWQEVCYTAQGFEIHDLARLSVNVGARELPVTRMWTVQGARIEPVTYWITLGNRVVKNRVDRMIYIVLNALEGKGSDGLLVRISSIDADVLHAYRTHVEFANDMLLALNNDDKKLLLGGD